jgi:hypothetical protein
VGARARLLPPSGLRLNCGVDGDLGAAVSVSEVRPHHEPLAGRSRAFFIPAPGTFDRESVPERTRLPTLSHLPAAFRRVAQIGEFWVSFGRLYPPHLSWILFKFPTKFLHTTVRHPKLRLLVSRQVHHQNTYIGGSCTLRLCCARAAADGNADFSGPLHDLHSRVVGIVTAPGLKYRRHAVTLSRNAGHCLTRFASRKMPISRR